MESENKVNMVLKPDIIEVEFEGQKFKLEKYISLENRFFLVKNYLQTYYGVSVEENEFTNRYVQAEASNCLLTIAICTNIDIENLSYNDVVCSGLWEIIKQHIVNFWEVQNDFERSVEKIEREKDVEKSIGMVLEKFFDRVSEFAGDIKNFELNDSTLEKLSGIIEKVYPKEEVKNTIEKVVRTRKNKKEVVQ